MFFFIQYGVFTGDFVRYTKTMGEEDSSTDGVMVLIFITMLFWELLVFLNFMLFYSLCNFKTLRENYKHKMDQEENGEAVVAHL